MNNIYRVNIQTQNSYSKDDYEITEKDFYPPEDIREFKSGIEDIEDGDNFEDYVKYFYENYENIFQK